MSEFDEYLNKAKDFFNVEEADPRDIPQSAWRSTGPQHAGGGLAISPTGAYYPEAHVNAPDLGLLGSLGGAAVKAPLSFVNQARYGMNEEAANQYKHLAKTHTDWANMSEADKVSAARGAIQPSGATPIAGTNVFTNGGSSGLFSNDGSNTNLNVSTSPATQNTGTFKPYTATTGSTQVTYGPEGVTSELTGPAGTYKDTALGQASAFGTQLEGLLGADTSQRAGEISQAQLDLMAPQLQALRHQMGTNLYGSGREGLNVAASGLGFEGGLVNPERLERNIAESEAARQATAFGQTQAQSELNQQIANMMGAQQGMFGQFGTLAGLEQSAMNPALAGLVANQNWQQYQDMLPLNQAMMQANIDKANYQPDPLMTGLLGLGTSFLGTSAGGNWLSNLL